MTDSGETLVRSSELAEALRERDEARRELVAHNCVCDDPPRCPVFDRAEKAERERDEARRERDAERARCLAWVDEIEEGCGCCVFDYKKNIAARVGLYNGAPAPREG